MNIKPKMQQLISSKIIVIVIDSSNFGKKIKKTQTKGEVEKTNDAWISNALDNISRSHRKHIYPIIIFSKFDKINERLITNLKLPKKPPSANKLELRSKYAQRLLNNFYPATLNILKSNKFLNFEDNMFIFTSVKTVRSPKGILSPALKRTSGSGFVLDFSYNEFTYFITYLEKISGYIENNLK
jgi:hypothetical protein